MEHRPERSRPAPETGVPARPQFGWMRVSPAGRPANENRRPLLARLTLVVLALLAVLAAIVGLSVAE